MKPGSPTEPIHPTTSGPSATGSLARLQRALTFAVLLAALAWLLGWWRHSQPVAWAGFVAIALGHAFFLAIEFAAASKINRTDSAPRASRTAMVRAWLIECGMTPRVFYWRQPFFSTAIADRLPDSPASDGRRGVVLIHGFVCNRGFWNPWLKRLHSDGRAFVAVSLEPVIASIDDYTQAVEQAVRQVTHATGLPPLLVCHSMGGLVARAWLRSAGAGSQARVHHIVTIASPHHGTWLGRFSHHVNGRQMNLHSAWLEELRRAEPPARDALFTCWYSNCDNIVFPCSTATLPGAENRFVPGVPHVALAFRPEVMRETLALL